MMNNSEPTEHEKQIARKLAKAYFGDSPLEDALYLDALAVITAAKQQQNEDTARLDWLGTNFYAAQDKLRDITTLQATSPRFFREAIDAARGVQPAAKEDKSVRPLTKSERYQQGERL